MPEFEWDDRKSEETRRGFGFEIVHEVDWEFAVLSEVQFLHGEERELWLAPTPRNLLVVVIVERGRMTRVVSIRTAKQREIERWRHEINA
ncbi:BrnT family toxin [Minwuia sp.]|uniref:BrnT family toxin n=1 Tax=Minwuia sp. TaxID=2493630 RepID=UPI003A91C6E6